MNVVPIKGAKTAPRGKQTKMETLLLSPVVMEGWKNPPFQRQKKINDKVREVSDKIKAEGGIIPGILTLGQLPHDRNVWLLDGQHRREAALLSGLDEFIADIRVYEAVDMADMGEEFVRLNSSLVRMTPDDVLRGMEAAMPLIHKIRKECPFVGYGQVRRGTASPMLSMSAAIRCWVLSSKETPSGVSGGAITLAWALTDDECEHLVRFLVTARAAWGDDLEYARLWGNLNLTICMWLYRRLVVDRVRTGSKRVIVLTVDQFRKCLLSLSASHDYLDWLVGRNLSERDRSPALMRIKSAFASRLRQDGLLGGHKHALPQPAWASR